MENVGEIVIFALKTWILWEEYWRKKMTNIVTDDGRVFVRRVTTVQLPNGKFRYPMDYFDATPGVVRVTEREKKHLMVPGYKQLI